MHQRRARWLPAAILAALLAACAQSGPPAGDRARGPGHGGSAEGPGGAGLGSMRSPDDARRWLVEQSSRELVDVQQRLHITPEQTPAWNAYATAVGALVSDLGRFDAEPLSATSLQRVDRRVDRARDRYTALENVADTMRALYATLNDEQRATADRVLVGTVPSLYEGSPFMGGVMNPAVRRALGSENAQRRGRGDPPPR